MKKLSLVIPVYNEEKTIEELIAKVEAVSMNYEKEFVIVEDGSKDKSREILEKYKSRANFKVLFNEKNLGKSQTVRRGIIETTGDLVVVQDADFEYDPNEIVDLLNKMESENLDIVYGNRFGKKNKVIYWQNYIGNRSLSIFSNLFTYPRIRVTIPDMEVCYKLMKGDIAREVGATIISKSSFGLEPEVTAKLSKYKLNGMHLKFGIVPISYYPRSIAEGKKMKAIEDGIKALIEIVRFNLF